MSYITPASRSCSITPANSPKAVTATGVLPFVGESMRDWFSPMTLGIVRVENVDGEAVESVKWRQTMGVVMPMKEQRILNKPEGQRAWIWKSMYTAAGVQLALNDILEDSDKIRYRVMGKADYSQAGYMYYELAQDYVEPGNFR